MSPGRRPFDARQWFAFALPFGLLALFAARFFWICDDAFIAFRYARHLASGLGLRWNPGESPPVEGYSTLGWVLLGACFERAGMSLATWCRVTSMACSFALLGSLLVVLRVRLRLGLPGALSGALLFACSPSTWIWSSGGLCTMAFALAVFVAWERLLGDPARTHLWGAAAACLLAALLRADGFVWNLALVASALLVALRERRPALLRQSLQLGSIVLLAIAAHTLFRLVYHGDWVPNTARAKVGLSALSLQRGGCYVVAYWLALPTSALLFAFGCARALRPGDQRCAAATSMAAATFVYALLSGGDFMSMGRFLMPAVAFLAVVGGVGVDSIERRAGGALAWATSALLLALLVPAAFDQHLVPRSWRARFDFRWGTNVHQSERTRWDKQVENAADWLLLGRALALHLEPHQSLATRGIGAIGYASDIVIHDQNGLVNRVVHESSQPVHAGRTTPGHDYVGAVKLFAPEGVDYMRARLLWAAQPDMDDATWSGWEKYPLSVADGFERNGWLLLKPYTPRSR